MFNQTTYYLLRRLYIKVLLRVLQSHHFADNDFLLSDEALKNVFLESQKDIDFLRQRRPLKQGVSIGKIVGALVFRLCRTNVISFSENVINNPQALKVPVDASLAFGLELCHVTNLSGMNNIVRELKYFLAKRHINQESLGICFDVLSRQSCASVANHMQKEERCQDCSSGK